MAEKRRVAMAHSAGLMAAAEAHPKFKGRVSTGDVFIAFLFPEGCTSVFTH